MELLRLLILVAVIKCVFALPQRGNANDDNKSEALLQNEDNSGQNRIVGGDDVDRGQYPFFVSLYKDELRLCGGTILDRTTILTAAHCFLDVADVSILKVRAGEHKYDVEGRTVQTRNVQRVIVHNKFNKDRTAFVDRDIAIVKLSEPLVYTRRVQKIALADERKERRIQARGNCVTVGLGYINNERKERRIQARGNCVTVGLGYINTRRELPLTIQEIAVEIRPRDYCSEAVDFLYEYTFTKYQLCTRKLREGICRGDSGGPLICFDAKNKPKQLGIVSWYTFTCEFGFNVYTRVATLTSWVNSNKQ